MRKFSMAIATCQDFQLRPVPLLLSDLRESWLDRAKRRRHRTVRKGKGIRPWPVSGAVGTRVGRDGSLLRRSGIRGRRFRLRNGLGTFALVVKVANPARVRLFAAGTKFSAHRIMILAPNAIVGNPHRVRIHTVEERAPRPFSGRRRPALDPPPFTSAI